MSTSSSRLGNDRPVSILAVPRLILREALPLLVGALVVFGVLEVVLRAADDFDRNGPGRIGREWTGESTYINHGKPWFAREFVNTVVLNEEGYHAPSFSADPERPRRIVVVGDSYVKAGQLPLRLNFVQVAQSKLEGTQLLALGRGGLYSPLHGQVFAEELPRLFGPGGKYPEVDAVVFCIRLWGGMSIAEGVYDYPVSMPDVRWTYPIKAPVVTRLQRLLVRPVAAPLHSASLVSSKLIDWLRADLRNQQNAVDLEAVEAVAPVLRDEVFIPIRAHAARIDIPIAFLYLPSIAEYERNQGPVQARMRELTLAALEEAGVLWMDASDWVVGEPEASDEFFFPVDHHPNAGGHARMGEALAAIVRALELQD